MTRAERKKMEEILEALKGERWRICAGGIIRSGRSGCGVGEYYRIKRGLKFCPPLWNYPRQAELTGIPPSFAYKIVYAFDNVQTYDRTLRKLIIETLIEK